MFGFEVKIMDICSVCSKQPWIQEQTPVWKAQTVKQNWPTSKKAIYPNQIMLTQLAYGHI